MMRLLLIVLLAVMLAAFVGCSKDQSVNPQRDVRTGPARLGLLSSTIGPSEIVFCIDVSDSISADELSSIVDGLGGCLSNQTLIPQNGAVTVALTVYADTTAVVLGPTAVTGPSLQNTILPALQGLLTNRVVAVGRFDLSGALTNASTILSGASAPDRQVLVVGSGAATDPTAVGTAAQALASAHIMASALAVGADNAGTALLQSIAATTGGFFAAGAGCSDAFAYMLLADIELMPKTASLQRNAVDTVTAAVFRGANPTAYPVADAVVDFAIVSGPNASLADTVVTDAKGMAAFIYTGAGAPGTDVIVATALHPGTGTVMTDTATVTWVNAPPVCNAGGPYTATVTTDAVEVPLSGALSSDADGDSLRFHWSVPCAGASFSSARAVSPVLTLSGDCLCVDSVMVRLVVSDGFDSTMCEAAIHIVDLRPPVIVMRSTPLSVWPPNHKYRTVTPDMMVISVTDACGRPIPIASALVMKVTSDEPDNAKGDGDTANDIAVTCPNRVDLRAERMGGGNGRVYTIVYRFFTENGVSADAVGTVVVPHDQSGKQVIDSGPVNVVIPQCGPGR
jgi:hypothetical protein